MSKAKLYKIDNGKTYNSSNDFITFVIGIIVYAIVLMITSNLFRAIYVENFLYAIIAALILSFLNYTIKPLLVYFTLPLSLVTFGLAYPIVNVIILNLCDLLMGKSFVIEGFFSSIVIAVFISFLKILLDNLITKRVK